MPTIVKVDGAECTIESLPNGLIRVSHRGQQMNPLHGPDTCGECSYLVHPCQRNQYEFWMSQFPPQERLALEGRPPAERPWWSSGAGERANLRE